MPTKENNVSKDITIATGDSSEAQGEASEVIVILDRLRSTHNIGSILRLVDAVNGKAVYTCGYTATPPHQKLEKTAMGCDQFIPCENFETACGAIEKAKSLGYQIIAVETAETAQYYDKVPFQKKTAFIFGNEALGISQDALELSDSFIKLPARGRKNSINVANCAAIVLFEYLKQQ